MQKQPYKIAKRTDSRKITEVLSKYSRLLLLPPDTKLKDMSETEAVDANHRRHKLWNNGVAGQPPTATGTMSL